MTRGFWLVVLAACTGHSEAAVADDRPIELMVASDPETLDPRYATDSVGLRATRLIHAGLVRLDPDTLEPRPYLARSWTWLDPLTLRIELRDDVQFHSGGPLRPMDVVATLAAFGSPGVASRHARVVEAIGGAEPDGEHAVVVRLARPHGTLLTDLELPVLRADQAASPPCPDGSLDGLGPYSVAHFTRGSTLLVPAERSALPRPARALILRTVHDENARALRLEAGKADIAPNLISPTLLPALEGTQGLAVRSRPGANLTYLVVHETRPLLADVRIRRAISLSVDRTLLCRTLFDARAQPATGLIAPAHWAHAPLPPLPFDPEAARNLLAAVHPGAQSLTLLTSTDRLRLSVARVIAQELAAVGLRVEVISLELGTLISRLNAGDFDLASLQLPEMTEPNVLRHFLHSAFVPPDGANRGRVHDAVLDALLDHAERISNIAERRTLYVQVEERAREQVHLIPLWVEDQVVVTSERARAFLPSAEGRWLAAATLR